MNSEPHLDRMLRLPAVEAITGVRRTAIAEMIERGEFPRPVFLSDGGRAKAWLESELREWQARRIAAREAEAAGGRGPRQKGQYGAKPVADDISRRDKKRRTTPGAPHA